MSNNYSKFIKISISAIIIFTAVFIHAEDKNPKFSFEVTKTPVLKLGTLPLFSGMEFYFSEKNWFRSKWLYMINLKKAKLTGNEHSGSLTVSQEKDSAPGYDLKISWSARRFDMSLTYEIPQGSSHIYGVVDLFLNKGLFVPDKSFSEGQDSLGNKLNEKVLVFKNSLGDFKFCLESSDNKISPWHVRDTRHQKWRSEEHQTTDILNCTRGKLPVPQQTIKMSLDYLPSESAGDVLKARTAAFLVEKLKNRFIPPDYAKRLDYLEKQLDTIVSTGKPGAIEPLCSEVNGIAEKLSEKCSSYRGEGIIIPSPQSLITSQGRFILDSGTSIAIAPKSSAEVASCASILSAQIQRFFGLKLSGNYNSGNKVIRLSLDKKAIPGKKESYFLRIDKSGVEIQGTDERGLFYGTQSFFQMLEKDKNLDISAQCATIRDWPDIPFRGMMIEMGKKDSFDLICRTLEMLAMYKYNVVIFGQTGNYNIKWDSHPELALKNALTARQLREFAKKSRKYFLDPIPLIQCTGHNSSVLRAHPELADSPNPKNLGNALCLANPSTKKLLADLFDECVDIYKPKYFHLGGDEAYPIGTNPICKGKKVADLYAKHIKWCSNYLKSKGVNNVIMWHDMLLDKKAWPSDVPAHSASPSGTFSAVVHPAVKKLPRNLIIAYWNYNKIMTSSAPIPYFQQFGYQVLCSSWFDDRNSYDHGTAAFEHKALGILNTNWGYCAFRNQMSLVSVENAWTVNKPAFEKIPYDPVKRLQATMLPPLVSNYVGTDSKPLDINGQCNISLDNLIHYAGANGLLLLPEGARRFGDINFKIIAENPDKILSPSDSASQKRTNNAVGVANGKNKLNLPAEVVKIKVGEKIKGLAFLYTCCSDQPFRKNTVANYVIHYKNGETLVIPVVKRSNVIDLQMPFEIKEHRKRGAGSVPDAKRIWLMTDQGDELNFQVFEWQNPQPEKEVEFFNIVSDSRAGGDVFVLLATSIIK